MGFSSFRSEPGPPQMSRINVAPPVRVARFSIVPRRSTGLLRRRVVRNSRLHTSIYEDGYAVLRNFVNENELPVLTSNSFLEGQAAHLLRSLVGDLVKVELELTRVQRPGFKCTDGVTSPEPWWEHMWEVEKVDIDEQPSLDSATTSAKLVLSYSEKTLKHCGGGFCVYPRSHWLVADWLRANSQVTGLPPVPNIFDVPASIPIELELGCGDAVILHPLSAWCMAPNISKSTTKFAFLKMYIEWPIAQQQSGSQIPNIWRGWTALAGQLAAGLPSFQSHEVKLLEEDVKAVKGGWATRLQPGGLPMLPLMYSYVAPGDRLAWQLTSCVDELMQKEKWEEALLRLQRLAGLRPKSFWVTYHAGRCCRLSAPCGQLAGRAGRKSLLEDAERFLLRAIEMAPGWPLAYLELSQVLLLLGRGREKEILGILQTMSVRCNMDQLLSKYAEAYDDLKQCQELCEVILTDLSA